MSGSNDPKDSDFDFGSNFDDLDGEFWEDYYGGSEDSSFLDDEDHYLASWADKSRSIKSSGSDSFVVKSHNQFAIKCKSCGNKLPVTNFVILDFSKRFLLSNYKDIKSLLTENKSRFRCSKCGRKDIIILKNVSGKFMPAWAISYKWGKKVEEKRLVRCLNSVGKECFVKYFALFSNESMSNKEIADIIEAENEYTRKSCDSRTSHARMIIRDGDAKEALHIVSSSKRLEIKTRLKAKEIIKNIT